MLSDRMLVPDPVAAPIRPPVKRESSCSFAPRSNPASCVLSSRTGPEIIGFAVDPETVSAVVTVPPCSRDPCGSLTPSAGRNASSSSIGTDCPLTRRLIAVVGPLAW